MDMFFRFLKNVTCTGYYNVQTFNPSHFIEITVVFITLISIVHTSWSERSLNYEITVLFNGLIIIVHRLGGSLKYRNFGSGRGNGGKRMTT